MYDNIQSGAFMEGPNGPARFRTNIVIPLKTNQREYKLEERSTLEQNFLVGLWVTKPGTVVETGKTQAVGSVFDSASLTLRSGTNDVMRRVYFHQIYATNLEGRPCEVSIPGKINLVESLVEVRDETNILANTVLELQVDYVQNGRR